MKFDVLMGFGSRFLLFQVGTSLGIASGHIFRLSIAWWCLRETQSAMAFSSLIALSVATEIYLKPFLASFGDHFNRVRCIISCQIAVLVIVAIFCIVNTFDYFNLLAVTAGLIIMSAVISVREPTIMGLIPDLVNEGQVTRAISSRSAINSVIMLIGPVIAASIISVSSINVALYISAMMLGFSCFAFAILLTKDNVVLASHSGRESWFLKTKGAFTAIYRVKSELYIALISLVVNFTMFPFFSVTIPYWINTELKLPVVYLGAFEFFFALGLIIGSIYLNSLVRNLLGRLYNIVLGFVLLGSSVMAIVIVDNIFISILLAFFCGVAFIFINVNLSTLRSTATPRDYRTRMSAMAVFVSSLANPFGVAIAGLYINWNGVVSFTLVSGGVVILIAPIVMCSLHLRKALSLDEAEMKGYYEKTYPKAFYKRG